MRVNRSLVAIQRIFLDPTTADYTRKVMLGTPLTGAWRGREGGTTLAIAEGFETADAFARLNDTPCWASLDARRLDQLVIPAAITTLLIAEDNDPEGHRAADKAEARYVRSGLGIEGRTPPRPFKDLAKALDAVARSSRI